MWDENWEQEFLSKKWGKYPNEDLVRFFSTFKFEQASLGRPNLKVLDLGCGSGSNSWFLSKEGGEVCALDGSETALLQARANLEFFDSSVDLVRGDLVSLPFKNDVFDVIIDVSALQHNVLSSISRIVAESRRVLKPGGYIFSHCLSDQTTVDPGSQFVEVGTYRSAPPFSPSVMTHFFSRGELSELWEGEGSIRIIESKKIFDLDRVLAHFIVVVHADE